MSVWHMQPDLAASRRQQHKQLYQVQGATCATSGWWR